MLLLILETIDKHISSVIIIAEKSNLRFGEVLNDEEETAVGCF